MIMKCVQHQLDGVIVKDIFPSGQAGADVAGLVIEANENRI